MLYYPAVRRRLPSQLVTVTVFLLTGAPAWAWGCRGHQIVALIAAAHLQPAVAARVRQILAIPASPEARRPCRGSVSLPPLARVAGWADAVRTASTDPFHFVNLPLDARRGHVDYAAICQSDCISAVLNRYLAQLRAPATSPRQRAVALRYVIHLVGDAFQPLHVSDNADRGGNCVRTRLPRVRRRSDLHADWDSQILNRMMRSQSPVAYARRLEQRFGRRYAAGSLRPLDWIWSSHAVAVGTAYGPLHLAPGCHARTLRLRPAYVRGAEAAIAVQLDRAGWRLAAVLNQELAR